MSNTARPSSPYSSRPDRSFWRTAVSETSPLGLKDMYRAKWPIGRDERIATAGSCFAQHVARYLRRAEYTVLDLEPAPLGLTAEEANYFGYGLYSARYANIYTARQLLQLVREAAGTWTPSTCAWPKKDRFVDAFRPSVEPEGLETREEVEQHRAYHVGCVRKMFEDMDVLVFTLGLTEAWRDKVTHEVFPTAPGTVGGNYDPERHEFVNFTYPEILADMQAAIEGIDAIRGERPPFRLLLTVSPVPLTATASDNHVLAASTWSKATLRSVAGDLADSSPRIDYFPSFEIVTNPASRGIFYSANLRSVTNEGVEVVMRSFLSSPHAGLEPRLARSTGVQNQVSPAAPIQSADDVQCEEALLDAFAPN